MKRYIKPLSFEFEMYASELMLTASVMTDNNGNERTASGNYDALANRKEQSSNIWGTSIWDNAESDK